MNSKKAFTHTPSFSVRKSVDILHPKGKNFLLRVINTKKLGVTLLCKGGFTLIELLVTISIITFLMSFVMASLSSARNKAIDSNMKTSLSSMRSQAAIYYDGASSYVGLCANQSIQAALISAASSTNTNIQINALGDSSHVTCNATTTGWAIQTPLKTNSNQFFCVDSNGTAVVTEQVFGSGNDVACGAGVASGVESQMASAGIVADDVTAGTLIWSNPSRIVSSNDSYANTTAGSPGNTHYLKATNFGFNIPAGSTINGILIEIEKSFIEAVDTIAHDNEVKIVKSDGIIGVVNKALAGNWTITDAYYPYGASSDLWGETWSASDINDIDFGVVLSGYRSGCNLLVDHIRVTVYYTTH